MTSVSCPQGEPGQVTFQLINPDGTRQSGAEELTVLLVQGVNLSLLLHAELGADVVRIHEVPHGQGSAADTVLHQQGCLSPGLSPGEHSQARFRGLSPFPWGCWS